MGQLLTYIQMTTDEYSSCCCCGTYGVSRSIRSVPCGHYYCCACIKRMALLALNDRSLVPVQCCKMELPIDYIEEALASVKYTSRHNERHEKSVEKALSKYERLLHEREWRYSDLVSDQEYKKTVRSFHCKQCPGCGIGIQRDWGCVHMRCPNGHEFCYTCLTIWRSCNCALIPDEEVAHILHE